MSSRQIFSEDEKICLQELIIKFKLNSTATIGAGNPAVKRAAWIRLTNEFNSIETNTKRTEAQLKKCWDNLKTRKKQLLALEKRERMKTGGGSYYSEPSTSRAPQEIIDDAVMVVTDVELPFVIDSDMTVDKIEVQKGYVDKTLAAAVDNKDQREDTYMVQSTVQSHNFAQPGDAETHTDSQDDPSQSQPSAVPSRAVSRRSGSQPLDYDCPSSRATEAKNVRAQVIGEEFTLRQLHYKRAEKREEELFKLKLTEKEWQVKAAQELYLKARIERETAEILLNITKKQCACSKDLDSPNN